MQKKKKKVVFLAILKFIGPFLLNRLLLLLIMCIYEYDTIRQYTFIILFGKKNHVKETWFYETKDYCISIYMRIKGIDMSHIKWMEISLYVETQIIPKTLIRK